VLLIAYGLQYWQRYIAESSNRNLNQDYPLRKQVGYAIPKSVDRFFFLKYTSSSANAIAKVQCQCQWLSVKITSGDNLVTVYIWVSVTELISVLKTFFDVINCIFERHELVECNEMNTDPTCIFSCSIISLPSRNSFASRCDLAFMRTKNGSTH
jgi:hypothetical protein